MSSNYFQNLGHVVWGEDSDSDSDSDSDKSSSGGSSNTATAKASREQASIELDDSKLDVSQHVFRMPSHASSVSSHQDSNSQLSESGSVTRGRRSIRVAPPRFDVEVVSAPVESACQEAHDLGTCKPCMFINSKAGCHKSETCPYCHLHPKKKVSRPCKASRKQCAEMVAKIWQGEVDPLEVLGDGPDADGKTSYMRSLIRHREIQERHRNLPDSDGLDETRASWCT